MTKLEEDLFLKMFGFSASEATESEVAIDELEREAKAAAEVCKGYIERAFDAGHDRGLWVEGPREEKEPMHKVDFLKSEGITE